MDLPAAELILVQTLYFFVGVEINRAGQETFGRVVCNHAQQGNGSARVCKPVEEKHKVREEEQNAAKEENSSYDASVFNEMPESYYVILCKSKFKKTLDKLYITVYTVHINR